jgi:oxygen-independent coproporphyrinogen-3 oxidase
MAGIYIHVPFCKQACHYCDFHFALNTDKRQEMLWAFEVELERYRTYLAGEIPDTLYFGGGTPSLLQVDEISRLVQKVREVFGLLPDAEITLEANPDDLTPKTLDQLKEAGINRLSIGIQSFHENELKWMNRAHNAIQAAECIDHALQAGFERITLDLIYGIPVSTMESWKENLKRFFDLGITHLSAYSLTVEKGTPLHRLIQKGQKSNADDGLSLAQYQVLQEEIAKNGWEQYEISNYCTQKHYSRHNTAYWNQIPYLGIGPSAHSFNGSTRSWNPRNNAWYLRSMQEGGDCRETEVLTPRDMFNERLMTGLRTSRGFHLAEAEKLTGMRIHAPTLEAMLESGRVIQREGRLLLSDEGKWFADAITAELFVD